MALGYDYSRRLGRAQRAVAAQRAVSSLMTTLQDAQLGQRGFLLTGEQRYLEPYVRARRELPYRLSAARRSLGADPADAAALDRIERAGGILLDELAKTVSLQRAGQRVTAMAIVQSDLGLQQMRQARAAGAEIVNREESALEAASAMISRRGPILFFLLALIGVAALLALMRSLSEARERGTALEETVADRTRDYNAASDLNDLIVKSATDFAIIVTDAAGIVTRWNSGAENLFGWSAAEMIGDTAERIFTPEDRGEDRMAAEMRFARETGKASDERWHLRKDEHRFWASGEMQPLNGERGLLGYFKIVRDRTAEREEKQGLERRLAEESIERERAQGQIRQLQRLDGLGKLTAGIAHDFNNMLAVVIGAVDMARRRLPDPDEKVTMLLDAATDGAERAAELTKRLLAFSRQQPLAPVVLDINVVVGGMSELLRRTIGKHVQLETVLAGGLWRVSADAGELENVLVNLAVNARDAMPAGGRLTIETANSHLDDEYASHNSEVSAGQYVALCVTDTGSGMPRDVLERAFDPFFSTKEVGKGTGLGLSQLYGFAKQSGGHAKIYSEEEHGTTVKLYLPRHHGAERPAAPRALASQKALMRGSPSEIILVVEDEERVRLVSVEALRDLGYTVRHAASGSEALALLEEQPGITLLFTDIVMPGMTGRELADIAVAQQPDLKILYTTGYTRNAVVHGGKIDPGVAFLAKPFTIEQLGTKVRAVLDGGGINRPV